MKNIHYNKNYQAAFWEELREEVKNYFTENGISPYASKSLWAKMIFLLATFIFTYISLFIFSLPLWGMWLLCILLGLLMCAIGFNISHQAAHGALSKNPKINRLMGLSLNLMGMSDYIWILKHNVSHHAFTNVYENDEALKEDETLRLSANAPWKPLHSFQHIYTPIVYAVFTIFWATTLDFDKLKRYNGWGSRSRKPHPTKELILFWGTKISFVTVYGVLPLLFLPINGWQWLVGFLTMHIVGSTLITHILQVEHLNEDAVFIEISADGQLPVSWAVNQLQGTTDFKTKTKLFQWFIGPVNYQIEHHLFPNIAGNHLPAIAKIVEEKAKKYNLNYQSYPSFAEAVLSHYKLLKELGKRPQDFRKADTHLASV
ncbi:MAG: acyl-CoA desaturase [Bacteroidetes bacterium]|nr:acyl-CoA desaturase [Bacteroidota bacterium]